MVQNEEEIFKILIMKVFVEYVNTELETCRNIFRYLDLAVCEKSLSLLQMCLSFLSRPKGLH